MKILHFADAHLGVDNRGKLDPETGLSLRIIDFLDALDEIINIAYDEDIDLALFAGDAFHSKNPPADIQALFAERMYDLAKQCTVVLLVGNHDIGSRGGTALSMYDALRAQNVIIGNKYEILHLQTKRGVAHVATFPYPTKHALGATDWQDRAVKIKEKIARLSEEAEQYYESGDPIIFLGHITVMGARYGSEQHMAFVDRAVVDIEDLGAGPWDYVALGHFHSHQVLLPDPPIVYAGSIERVSFNEEHDDKGCCIISKTDNELTWEFVSVGPRPMISIKLDIRNDSDPTRTVLRCIRRKREAIEDAIVKIVLSVTRSAVGLLDANLISRELDGCTFFHELKFDIASDDREQTRLSNNVVAMSDIELLEEYLDPVISNDVEYSALLDLAEDIMREA